MGYYTEKQEYYEKLPVIKRGVLSPMTVLPDSIRKTVNPTEINLLYAKDYNTNNDLNIILKGLRNL